jgi:hypothetical protein
MKPRLLVPMSLVALLLAGNASFKLKRAESTQRRYINSLKMLSLSCGRSSRKGKPPENGFASMTPNEKQGHRIQCASGQDVRAMTAGLSVQARSLRRCTGLPVDASVDVTPYSRCARTPSPRNRGRVILNAGGVCVGSALQWWLRLFRVFPVCDRESGSVFGLIIGDLDPGTSFRIDGSRLQQ